MFVAWLFRFGACSVLLTVGLLSAACDLAKDSPVDGSPTTEERPDTQPGDDPLADDLPPLIRQHLDVEFPDEEWVDEVREIDHEGAQVTVQMSFDFDGNRDDFLEACTAVAGFTMTPDRFGVREVIFEDEDGEAVMRADMNEPRCFPVAT